MRVISGELEILVLKFVDVPHLRIDWNVLPSATGTRRRLPHYQERHAASPNTNTGGTVAVAALASPSQRLEPEIRYRTGDQFSSQLR